MAGDREIIAPREICLENIIKIKLFLQFFFQYIETIILVIYDEDSIIKIRPTDRLNNLLPDGVN